MHIKLTVPGNPQGKQRPKAMRKGQFTGIYTPEKTVNYETYIKELFVTKYPDFMPMVGPLIMQFTAFVSIPASTSQKKKALMLDGLIIPEKTPDIDNILKIIMDALESVAYKRDSQIAVAVNVKLYSERPRLELIISDQQYLQEWLRNNVFKRGGNDEI